VLGREAKRVAGFVPPAAQVLAQLMDQFWEGGQEVPTFRPPESFSEWVEAAHVLLRSAVGTLSR
jgi:hypothetical protein